MKKTGPDNRGVLYGVLALSAVMVLLWMFFYYLTVRMIRGNMRRQAETGAAAITSEVEEVLLGLEDAAYELAHYEDIAGVAGQQNAGDFCAAGGDFVDAHPFIPGKLSGDDTVAVFGKNGLFYRIRGSMPNTALMRVFYLCENGSNRTITVASYDSSYIGAWEEISIDGESTGYVALLTEMGNIRRILETYNDLDYLGVVLLSGARILCSNKELRYEELEERTAEAIFVNEKNIGLSGFRLLVYCEKGFSGQIGNYYRLVMPVTVLILAGVLVIERRLYLAEVGRREAGLQKQKSLISLLKKQISAHFTVNTLNVVRAMIKKGEKEGAAHICDELSTLLRYANAGDEYISLMEEFYVLRQYVGVMQARYPGRVEALIEEEDFFDSVFIPRMLIQPVVENAIVHGLGGSAGTVQVKAELRGEDVIISVKDNGKGLDEESLKKLRESIDADPAEGEKELEHVALRNIQRRIRLVCGEEYGLGVYSCEGEGCEAVLTLPARGKDTE